MSHFGITVEVLAGAMLVIIALEVIRKLPWQSLAKSRASFYEPSVRQNNYYLNRLESRHESFNDLTARYARVKEQYSDLSNEYKGLQESRPFFFKDTSCVPVCGINIDEKTVLIEDLDGTCELIAEAIRQHNIVVETTDKKIKVYKRNVVKENEAECVLGLDVVLN